MFALIQSVRYVVSATIGGATAEVTRANFLATGYDARRIALPRLDTDWYESTRQEPEHLYPRLSAGGVLILPGALYR